jgi:hypothetical protein
MTTELVGQRLFRIEFDAPRVLNDNPLNPSGTRRDALVIAAESMEEAMQKFYAHTHLDRHAAKYVTEIADKFVQ